MAERKTISVLGLVALLALLTLPYFGAAQTERPLREARDERTFREIPDIRGVTSLARTAYAEDGVLVKFRDKGRFEKVALRSGETVENALVRLSAEAGVEYVEPDYIAHTFFVPNDPLYQYQWHFDSAGRGGIGMEEAWNVSNGSGVIVAVIDTGVAYENHTDPNGSKYYLAPDLAGTPFTPGWDFVNNDSHANDDNGHGTHVAGTIAQSTNNNSGVAGVAFGANIMPIKVLNAGGSGTYSAIANGIMWAADNGADVINMSLGGSSGSQTLQDALAYAYNKGVTIVAATGNDGKNGISYPAAYNDYVIAVGATRYDEQRATYSNYGAGIDLVAPGGQMCSNSSPWYCIKNDQNADGYGDGVLQQTFSGATNNFGYYFFQGTSMATPHVAGAAALLIANGNAVTPDEVRAALQSTADDLGASGWDSVYGHGLVNASAALQYGAPPPPLPPPLDDNEAPVAVAQSISTNEDVQKDIALSATDGDGDSLTFSIVSAPSHGALSGTLPNLTYTPSANYAGNDSFTFRVHDGSVFSNTATVSITVHPVNDAPVVGNIPNVSFTTGQSTNIDLNTYVSDVDNTDSQMSWTVSGSTNVLVSMGSGNVATFGGVSGWSGSETLTLIATDPGGLSDSDTMTVTIENAQASPTATVSITMTSSGRFLWRANANVNVRVSGVSLSGAVVAGAWSGSYSGSTSGTTNGSGTVTFSTPYIWGSGTAVITVTEISKNGVTYTIAGEESDSVTVAGSVGR